MKISAVELIATVLFGLAVLHTFFVSFIERFSHRFPAHSIRHGFLHYMASVEVVFAFWALGFLKLMTMIDGLGMGAHGHIVGGSLAYLEQLNFSEPIFVFAIMTMAATRPILYFAERLILSFSRLIPLPGKISFYISTMIIGPLLGSFITEPAAMTVTALVLLDVFYANHLKTKMSAKFRYATLGLLFVSVSIGGTLTPFAAPPVLMVAAKYGWDMLYMVTHLGYKSAISITISTLLVAFLFRKELVGKVELNIRDKKTTPPWWMIGAHILLMACLVLFSHHPREVLGILIIFIGFANITKRYQDHLKIEESLLVGCFLAGLVILGGMQQWWLKAVLEQMNDTVLYFGATALTAITDNAALTYLGSMVDLSESAKYCLVAGAVTGGGLTVIANAPNPAGYSLLKDSFGKDGISPIKLFLAALGPTLVAICCFQLLPHLI